MPVLREALRPVFLVCEPDGVSGALQRQLLEHADWWLVRARWRDARCGAVHGALQITFPAASKSWMVGLLSASSVVR
jgi:hypothetical protein